MPTSYPLDDDTKISTPENRLRRQLLKGTVGTVVVAAFAYVGWTKVFFPPDAPTSHSTAGGGMTGIKLGLISDFPEGAPPRQVTISSPGTDHITVYFVENLGAGSFRVLSGKCTHLGCNVAWQPNAHQFLCPCHSARYDVTGKVLAPPAPKPLPILKSRAVSGTLYLT